METLGLGVDSNLDASTVGGGSLEGVLARVEATRGELLANWVAELERLAIGADESIRDGVESQVTGECHGSDNIRGSDKRVGGGVSIVTASEVTVVRGDNWKEISNRRGQ